MHKIPVTTAILEHELSEVRLLLERETGVLLDAPNEVISEALTNLMEERRSPSAQNYIEALASCEPERQKLVDRLLSFDGQFFRQPLAFEVFKDMVVPEVELREGDSKAIRVWSAGCSTGQEAYSIAITLCEALKDSKTAWNLQVIASDIRSSAIEIAERGLYHESELKNVSEQITQSYFARIGHYLLVKPRLRNLVTFSKANLAKMNYIGRFDCIFCMDVLPHFSAAQRMALLQKLHLYLQPGGFLFLGDQEKLPATNLSFNWQRHSDYIAYQRPFTSATASGV